MPDSKIDKLPKNSPILKKNGSYFHCVEKMEKHFNESLGKTVDLMGIYALIQACKKAGYKEKIHGYRVMCWLSHHLAVKIKEGQKRPSRGISPRN